MTELKVLGNYPPVQQVHKNKLPKAFGDKDKNKIINYKNKVRAATLAGSVAASGLFLSALEKYNNPKNFKFSNLFKQNFKNPIKVMGLATVTMLGGLAGGLLSDDKSKRKAKVKEAIHQFIGNILVPISIVGAAVTAIEKQNYPRKKEIILSGIASIAGVVTGIITGNYAAGKINEKLFKENDKRHIGPKDFSIHVDDIMTLIALTSNGEKVQSFIGKALPAIFLLCGYEAGTSKLHDNPEEIH